VLKSRVVKRSVAVSGHKTSITLEDEFWRSLRDIAHSRQTTLSTLLAGIDSERCHGNLSSAIRLFVLHWFQQALSKCARGDASESFFARPEQILEHTSPVRSSSKQTTH
jgi:predicted DNA-binding ribbon-helix-helix protein